MVRTLMRAIAFLLIAQACLLAGETQGDLQKVIKRARVTKDPAVLVVALGSLITEGSKDALKELKALLSNEERLKLLDPETRQSNAESRLYAILRKACEQLDGRQASDLYLALSESEGFGGFVPTGLYCNRCRVLLMTSGFVKDPSRELINMLEKEVREDKVCREGAMEALARVGNKEALSALRDISRNTPALRALIVTTVQAFRDRPRVFRLMVEGYVSGGEHSKRVLEAILTRKYKVPIDHIWEPKSVPKYELMAAEHADVYVKELDKLLAYKGHRPLTEEERKKVLEIRAIMVRKAEEYKKQPRDKKPDEDGPKADEEKSKKERTDARGEDAKTPAKGTERQLAKRRWRCG